MGQDLKPYYWLERADDAGVVRLLGVHEAAFEAAPDIDALAGQVVWALVHRLIGSSRSAYGCRCWASRSDRGLVHWASRAAYAAEVVWALDGLEIAALAQPFLE